MRLLFILLVVTVAGCAQPPAPHTPTPEPNDTHVCIQSSDGLAECREIEMQS